MDAGFYVQRRSGLKLVVTIAATIVMVVLYTLLIPRFHSVGAAWATFGGFLALAVGTFLATQHIFRVCYEWQRLAVMLTLAVAFWSVSRGLPLTLWACSLKFGVWLLWPMVLWRFGFVSSAEKSYLKSIVSALLKRELDQASETKSRPILDEQLSQRLAS